MVVKKYWPLVGSEKATVKIDENLSPAACLLHAQHTFLEVAAFASSEKQEGDVRRRCFIYFILP